MSKWLNKKADEIPNTGKKLRDLEPVYLVSESGDEVGDYDSWYGTGVEVAEYLNEQLGVDTYNETNIDEGCSEYGICLERIN